MHSCVDCEASDKPPLKPRKTHPDTGPGTGVSARCATHLRALRTRQRKQARGRAIERAYELTAGDAHELLLFQGGRCWLCRRATGATKSLAVDHDHKTGEVRGRLCGPCNQFIGKLRDDPEAAQRLLRYLVGDTPYRRMKAAAVLKSRGLSVVDVTKIWAGIGGALLASFTVPGGSDGVTEVRDRDGKWLG